jgi:hypothetical protein
MSAYCPECNWVGDEGDYPPCPNCGDGISSSSKQIEEPRAGKNKLDVVTFSKLMDEFGLDAASETLNDVNEGRIDAETVEKYLYTDESKEDYAERLRNE